jgi:acyl-CoA synthetase (AMP-forming)/AMP-acid ligase II
MIRNFLDDLRRTAGLNGSRAAIIDGRTGDALDWAAMDRRSDDAAAFLASRGVGAGDRLLVMLPNGVDCFLLFLGCMKLGAELAPLPPQASPREAANWSALTHPKAAVLIDSTAPAVAEAIAASGAAVTAINLADSLAWLPEGAARPARPARSGRLLLKTSGTTGEPKAMVFDIDRLWSSGCAFLRQHDFVDADARFLNNLPMSYLGGLFNLGLIPLAAGGCFVAAQPFSGTSFLSFWQDVERFEVNVLWMVPTIVRGLLAIAGRTHRPQVERRRNPVRAAFLGTAPIDLPTKEAFEATFQIPLVENFALSETTFFTTETLGSRFRREAASVGEPLPYVELRLGARPDSAAEAAEIEVRSPFLFLGYLGADGEIVLPLTDDGFFRTGDLGHFNAKGSLEIDGRSRDIIKKGGHFVSLREVELLAEQNPAVREAVAVPVPHDFYGEDFCLAVRLNDGHAEDALGGLKRWLHDNLVNYKWPQRIVERTDFPRTASGKVIKKALADEVLRTEG